MHIDGVPLDSQRLTQLHRETAWVDPAVQLWNRSLLDNLSYGAPADPSLPIGQVIAQTHLRSILERLPDGLQTRLGEGGALISGGEGQRVRLGRVMLRRGAAPHTRAKGLGWAAKRPVLVTPGRSKVWSTPGHVAPVRGGTTKIKSMRLV